MPLKWMGWRLVMDHLLIQRGELIPRWYGVAWRMHDMDASVVMPVPLNIFVGLTRRAWHWMRFVSAKWSVIDELVIRSYDRGYAAGRHCRNLERRHAEQDIRAEATEQGQLAALAASLRGDPESWT